MAVQKPYPELNEVLAAIGEAGRSICDINASEAAAGNISVYIGWEIEPQLRFPNEETLTLPDPAPELAQGYLLISGSGQRLRDIHTSVEANLGIVRVHDDGRTATLYTAPERQFARVTSEFNSHLAVHCDQIRRTGTNYSAVIHAQPPHLTSLSHIPRYQDPRYFNQHILRWEPELIVQLPEGVAPLPFILPGSPELMAATLKGLRTHQIVVWGKHGVMARSDSSVMRASDIIEYAEAGARYEYLNIVSGEQGEGLSTEDIRAVAECFHVTQTIF